MFSLLWCMFRTRNTAEKAELSMDKETKFTIYGRPGCGYCHQAVRLLEASKLPFTYIDIYAEGLTKQDVAERVKQPAVHTMPQILHGDHYVGGCTELFAYMRG